MSKIGEYYYICETTHMDKNVKSIINSTTTVIGNVWLSYTYIYIRNEYFGIPLVDEYFMG